MSAVSSSVTHSDEFFSAVSSGDFDKVRELLSLYDVNCTDSKGWTALHHACHKGDLILVRKLSKLGADITIRTREVQELTPLHVAALAGKEKLAMALIQEFGCSTEVECKTGNSLLHSACEGLLIQNLVCDYKGNLNAQNWFKHTTSHCSIKW